MNLTIIGATGGIGRCLVEQALSAGHEVTAVVRDATRLAKPVRAVEVDLTADAPGLVEAVAGADAVLSGLGPRRRSDAGVTSRGTRAIVEAMQVSGAHRIIVVSAAPVGTVPSPGHPTPPRHDPGDGFVMRHVLNPLVQAAFGAHYADLARMEDVLRDSGLDWTAVRPPRLVNKPLSSAYRTAYGQNVPRGLTVSRAAVAHLMLRVIDEPAAFGQTIGVAS